MSLNDTYKVKEVAGEIEANKHIDAGWELLGVAGGMDVDKIPVFLYSLGWTSEEKPPHIG